MKPCNCGVDHLAAFCQRHTHSPNFGRLVPGCPRCDELTAGARPVVWTGRRADLERARSLEEIRQHDCKRSGCGPVCTFGDW